MWNIDSLQKEFNAYVVNIQFKEASERKLKNTAANEAKKMECLKKRQEEEDKKKLARSIRVSTNNLTTSTFNVTIPNRSTTSSSHVISKDNPPEPIQFDGSIFQQDSQLLSNLNSTH